MSEREQIAELKQTVAELSTRLRRLETAKRQSDSAPMFSAAEINYIQDRIRIRSGNVVLSSIYASRLALDAVVPTVTAINGYTPLYDASGNLLKVATLT